MCVRSPERASGRHIDAFQTKCAGKRRVAGLWWAALLSRAELASLSVIHHNVRRRP